MRFLANRLATWHLWSSSVRGLVRPLGLTGRFGGFSVLEESFPEAVDCPTKSGGTISHHSNTPTSARKMAWAHKLPRAESERAPMHAEISCSPCEIDRELDKLDKSMAWSISPAALPMVRRHS
eukprot:CAMPEP_0116115774 /NCGR_PEP_ID=MMETSP0329-20121206/685_1 /TAXON_ID=697910 /ORGANISM="Pseudo-nitzschia arenysensis, Strain B593" /LENGTH=122 /DNA_ID=CAMNT_0003609227 /DNA_START=131 /DNA_END=496 /DNA_ORIENTATION=+